MSRARVRVRVRGIEQFSPAACVVILAVLGALALACGWFSMDALHWATSTILAVLASL
jgi:hypothetical protein